MLFLVRILGIAGILFLGNERGIGPRLELDRVRARRRGGINQPAAEVHIAVMIRSHLGNDVGRLAGARFPLLQI